MNLNDEQNAYVCPYCGNTATFKPEAEVIVVEREPEIIVEETKVDYYKNDTKPKVVYVENEQQTNWGAFIAKILIVISIIFLAFMYFISLL